MVIRSSQPIRPGSRRASGQLRKEFQVPEQDPPNSYKRGMKSLEKAMENYRKGVNAMEEKVKRLGLK